MRLGAGVEVGTGVAVAGIGVAVGAGVGVEVTAGCSSCVSPSILETNSSLISVPEQPASEHTSTAAAGTAKNLRYFFISYMLL